MTDANHASASSHCVVTHTPIGSCLEQVSCCGYLALFDSTAHNLSKTASKKQYLEPTMPSPYETIQDIRQMLAVLQYNYPIHVAPWCWPRLMSHNTFYVSATCLNAICLSTTCLNATCLNATCLNTVHINGTHKRHLPKHCAPKHCAHKQHAHEQRVNVYEWQF